MTLTTRTTELIAKHIVLDPHRSGPAYARLRDEGVHVWALIAALQSNGWDLADVAEDFAVPAEAVEAAIAYYAQHHEAIDARLAINAAAFS